MFALPFENASEVVLYKAYQIEIKWSSKPWNSVERWEDKQKLFSRGFLDLWLIIL